MREESYHIVSCFVTSSDLANPKRLTAAAPEGCPQGARTMFESASTVPTALGLHKKIEKYGWVAEDNCHMFAQINRSDVLGEYFNVMVQSLLADNNEQQ